MEADMTLTEGSQLDNERTVYTKLYGSMCCGRPAMAARLSVGDIVRISKAKGPFEKGYLPSWSEELFKVDKIVVNQTPIMHNWSISKGSAQKEDFMNQSSKQ